MGANCQILSRSSQSQLSGNQWGVNLTQIWLIIWMKSVKGAKLVDLKLFGGQIGKYHDLGGLYNNRDDLRGSFLKNLKNVCIEIHHPQM